jgi:two-component system chemotaxis sensor kinase CheA
VIIIKIGDKRIGLIIDKIIGQQDIVLKSLGDILKNIKHISGATILGEGKVVILLDMLEIFETLRKSEDKFQFIAKDENPMIPEIKTKFSKLPVQKEKTILVVDDSKTVANNMRDLLSESGYNVQVAYDGESAYELAKTEKFDLFTVDVMMPKMDGYTLTKKIRDLPQYIKTPVVMVSAKNEKIDMLRGLDSGADDYVTKPFDNDELIALIRRTMN